MAFGGPGGPGNFGDTMGGNLPGGRGGGGFGDLPSLGASQSRGGLRGGRSGNPGMADRIGSNFNLGGLPAGIGPGQSNMAGVLDTINNGLRGFFSALGFDVPHREAVNTGSPGVSPNRYGGQVTTQQGYMDSLAPNFSAGYMGTVGASDPRSPYNQDYQAAHRAGLIQSIQRKQAARDTINAQIGQMMQAGKLSPSMRDQLSTAVHAGDLATLGQFGVNTSPMEQAFGAPGAKDVTTPDEQLSQALEKGLISIDDEGKAKPSARGALSVLSGPLQMLGGPLGMAMAPGLTGMFAGQGLAGLGGLLSPGGSPVSIGSLLGGMPGTALNYGSQMAELSNTLAAANPEGIPSATPAREGGGYENPLGQFLASLVMPDSIRG